MIDKTTRFAQAGVTSGSNIGQYTTGMIPQTIAKAEDVNLLLGESDKQLYSVCKEIVNLLKLYGVEPAAQFDSDNTQLATIFKTLVGGTRSLTGIDNSTVTQVPTQVGTVVNFTTFDIVFNSSVMYGDKKVDYFRTKLATQTYSANSSWENGVHYVFAERSGETGVVLSHKPATSQNPTPIKPEDGATKCLLGSVFVINGNFQSGSWVFTPWLQIASVEHRERITPATMGGYVSPAGGVRLNMGALQVEIEGLNYAINRNSPNIKLFTKKEPFGYKYLYPGYNPSVAEAYNVNTKAIYNTSTNTLDTISDKQISQWGSPRYMVIVPCVIPNGQIMLIPAVSAQTGDGEYTNTFASQQEAVNGIYSLQYPVDFKKIAARAIFPGQSIIIKIGATDFTDGASYLSVGMLPQSLAGYSTASGQSGGGSGDFIPMSEYDWPSTATSVSCNNNQANIVHGNADFAIQIRPPTYQPGIINQFSVKYVHTEGNVGLAFSSDITWWGDAPSWQAGMVYNLIFEYMPNGKWIGGVLARAA